MWARDVINQGTIPAATGVLATDMLTRFQTDYGADLIGCTISRILLTVDIPVSAANLVGIGIIKSNSSTPLANNPNPLTEPHADWMYWRASPADTDFMRLEVDNRSMRRLDEIGEQLELIMSSTAATSLTVNASWSVLVLLP